MLLCRSTNAPIRSVLRSRYAANGERTLRVDEVAVLPARLCADSLAGAVTDLARHRAHRRGLEVNVDVDRPPVRRGRQADIGRSDEPGRDQRAPEVVHLRPLERIARIEARQRRDVPCGKGRPTADADPAEMREGAWRHRKDEARGVRLVVNLNLLLTNLCKGEALLAEHDLERCSGVDDLLGDNGIAGLDGKGLAQFGGLGARGIETRKLDGAESILLARLGA